MNAIVTEGLSKNYRRHRALAGLNLAVPRGSVFGFLGPNGSGKTTTIKILMGLLQATAGGASILGTPVTLNPGAELKRKIGYLPEEVNFPEALTGWEVMEFVYRSAGLPARRAGEEISALMESFQLLGSARRRCASYSRGMKQRLGLACTLLHRPELLILDEPVSALDPEGRREILELMVALRGHGTVFFSSHVLTDVERVCDQVAVLNQGRLVVQSALPDLLGRYTYLQFHVDLREAPPAALVDRVRAYPWSKDVVLSGTTLTVEAEPDLAGQLEEELLPLLLRERQVVTSFYRRRPSLEEVFLSLLEHDLEQGRGKEGDHAAAHA